MAVFTDEQALQRAWDAYEIRNTMGRHAYYHALGAHREELDTIWSTRDDISWGNNRGFWAGRETMYNYYADAKAVQDAATLKLRAKHDPSIEIKEENYQLGAMLMHSLTTPLVEVAADGKTAQAMWYSLGQVTNAGPSGEASGMWMHERYAVDFIKEGESWRIWHFFVGTDLGSRAGEPFTGGAPMGGSEEDMQAMNEIMRALPAPTIEKPLYNCDFGWHEWPHWPEPHDTYDEAASYGPGAAV